MILRRRRSTCGYVIMLLFLIGAVVTFPLLLKISCINNIMSWLVSALEHAQYKEAYIGVWGGIIGSALGVLGAVMVQKRADADQWTTQAKKNATIIYYDIIMFYEELSLFAVTILDKKVWNKGNIDELIRFKRRILITDDWISIVASMVGVFKDDEWIKVVYEFYGVLFSIKNLMESKDSIILNQEQLKEQFLLLGSVKKGKYTYYKYDDESGEKDGVIMIERVLFGLEKLVPKKRGTPCVF